MSTYRFSALFLLCVFGAGILVPHRADAAGVIFRYLPGKPTLSSAVETTSLTSGPFSASADAAVRAAWGLPATHAADFQAPSSTMRSVESDDQRQVIGPTMTAEVWIRPSSIDGDVVLLTNRIGDAGGFVLAMQDGVPYIEIEITGTTYRLQAPEAIGVEVDHWVAATFTDPARRSAFAFSWTGTWWRLQTRHQRTKQRSTSPSRSSSALRPMATRTNPR